MRFLASHPVTPFGVHLTAISEWADYRWGPVTDRKRVPTLLDEEGYFYNFQRMPEFLANVNLHELQMEFRAQIEVVLAARLKPTHLDWHALRIGGRTDLFDVMVKLARDYGLALRVMGEARIDQLQSRGLPTSDYDFLDSYLLEPADKSARYAKMLHELPAGLSEWAVHPGLDDPELLAIERDSSHIRQTDYDFFVSQEAKDVVKHEGIILLDYRPLQQAWRGNASGFS